jgi:hypothetical protein
MKSCGRSILSRWPEIARRCYDCQVKPARVFVVVIAAALVGAPIVLDACSISCEAPAATAAGTRATCHHAAASRTAWIGTAPTRCGHDHDDQNSVIGSRDQARQLTRPGPASHPSAIAVSAPAAPAAGMLSVFLADAGARRAHAGPPIVTPLRI